jgi:oligopeptide transport system ATP-binding protein
MMPSPAPSPGPTSAANLLEVERLKVYFPIRSGGVLRRKLGDVRAVDDVSFVIRKGEAFGLVGESGCGKSTTGRAVLRLTDVTSGEIRFDGLDLVGMAGGELRRVRRRMQMIFQDPYSSLNPRMKVSSILSEPLEIHHLASGSKLVERVDELLQLVGLNPAYKNRYPHEFSGGQRQRIGIARALAVQPELIVCDEPISALDVSIQAQVLNLLTELREQFDLTYFLIAHDLAIVRHISDRVGVMYLGKLVEVGPPSAIYDDSGHPYTRALLSAAPSPDPKFERRRKRVILKGDVPSPADPPPGCRFHTRCWLYEKLGRPEECRTVDPELRSIGDEHQVACHYSGEAQKTDVGLTRLSETDRGRRYVPPPPGSRRLIPHPSVPTASGPSGQMNERPAPSGFSVGVASVTRVDVRRADPPPGSIR